MQASSPFSPNTRASGSTDKHRVGFSTRDASARARQEGPHLDIPQGVQHELWREVETERVGIRETVTLSVLLEVPPLVVAPRLSV